jgi:hypothetical protein
VEKKKFAVRLVAGAAALCITAALAAPSPAGAQSAPTGVGTSTASHALVSLQLGKLLDLGVMTDKAKSTIDSALSPASAFSQLVPLSLTSEALPVLNGLTANLPTFESRTPGGQPSVSGSAVDFASVNPGVPLPLPVGLLGGSLIPSALTSALDGTGAKSTLDTALTNLTALAGVLKVNSVSNKMSTSAALPNADAARGLVIDAITLLNLGDLLRGLGLDLAALPLQILENLLGTLDLTTVLPAGAPDLTSAVDGLGAAIDGVLSQVAGDGGLLSQVVNTVPGLSSLVSGLPLTSLPLATSTIPTASLLTGTVQNLLSTLQGTLTNLLDSVLNLLGGVPLLKLDGASVATSTKAAGTLADSAADVTAKLGGLSVLGLQLPGVDLLTIGNTLNAVTGQLTNVLGSIDPSLKDLVKVAVLDKATSVTTANGYNNALAGVSILSVSITPPALLSNLVSSLTGNTGLSALGKLSAAGVANPAASLPLIGGNMLNLGNLLNLPAAVGALTQGLSLKVGAIQSASQFKLASAPSSDPVAAPAPAPGSTLPRTGSDAGPLGMLAAGMAALALGVRRWARRPETD